MSVYILHLFFPYTYHDVIVIDPEKPQYQEISPIRGMRATNPQIRREEREKENPNRNKHGSKRRGQWLDSLPFAIHALQYLSNPPRSNPFR